MANNDELVKLIIDGENLLSDDINEAIGDLEKLSKESKETSDALKLLNQSREAAKDFEFLSKQVKATKLELADSTSKLAQSKDALKGLSDEARKTAQDGIAKLKIETQILAKDFTQQSTALKKSENALRRYGIKTKDLGKTQQSLALDVEKAEAAQQSINTQYDKSRVKIDQAVTNLKEERAERLRLIDAMDIDEGQRKILIAITEKQLIASNKISTLTEKEVVSHKQITSTLAKETLARQRNIDSFDALVTKTEQTEVALKQYRETLRLLATEYTKGKFNAEQYSDSIEELRLELGLSERSVTRVSKAILKDAQAKAAAAKASDKLIAAQNAERRALVETEAQIENNVREIERLNTAHEAGAQALIQYRTRIRELAEEEKRGNITAEKYNDKVEELRQELKLTEKEVNSVRKAIEKDAQAKERATNASEKLVRNQKAENLALNQAKENIEEYTRELKQLNAAKEKGSLTSKNYAIAEEKLRQRLKLTAKQTKLARLEHERLDIAKSKAAKNTDLLTQATRRLAQVYTVLLAAQKATQAVTESVKGYGDLESAITKVEKTTGLAREQVILMSEELRDLAENVTPSATNELLRYAEIAGQMGVSSSEDILKIVAAADTLAVSTDLAGEEAALLLARILGMTGEGIPAIGNLAGALVALGNDTKASESEIVKMTKEIVTGTRAMNFSSAAALGFGATLKELGQPAERSRSAISDLTNVILDLANEGGEGLEELINITGLTADAIEEGLGKAPEAVVINFIEGLKRAKDAGITLKTSLDGMGISSKETNVVIGVLADNTERLKENVNLSNVEFVKANAHQKEAIKAYADQNSALSRLNSRFTTLKTKVGEAYAPKVTEAAGAFGEIIKDQGDNIAELMLIIPDLIEGIGETAGAFQNFSDQAPDVGGVLEQSLAGYAQLFNLISVSMNATALEAAKLRREDAIYLGKSQRVILEIEQEINQMTAAILRDKEDIRRAQKIATGEATRSYYSLVDAVETNITAFRKLSDEDKARITSLTRQTKVTSDLNGEYRKWASALSRAGVELELLQAIEGKDNAAKREAIKLQEAQVKVITDLGSAIQTQEKLITALNEQEIAGNITAEIAIETRKSARKEIDLLVARLVKLTEVKSIEVEKTKEQLDADKAHQNLTKSWIEIDGKRVTVKDALAKATEKLDGAVTKTIDSYTDENGVVLKGLALKNKLIALNEKQLVNGADWINNLVSQSKAVESLRLEELALVDVVRQLEIEVESSTASLREKEILTLELKKAEEALLNVQERKLTLSELEGKRASELRTIQNLAIRQLKDLDIALRSNVITVGEYNEKSEKLKLKLELLDQVMGDVIPTTQDLAAATNELASASNAAGNAVLGMADRVKAAGSQSGVSAGLIEIYNRAMDRFNEVHDVSGQSVDELTSRLGELDNELRQLNDVRMPSNLVGLDQFINKMSDFTQVGIANEQSTIRQSISLQKLLTEVQSGTLSISEIGSAAQRADNYFSKLSDNQLAPLRSAIESARSNFRGLSDEINSTFEDTQDRLDNLLGNEADILTRRFKREMEELAGLLSQAQETGDRALVSQINAAISNLRKAQGLELGQLKQTNLVEQNINNGQTASTSHSIEITLPNNSTSTVNVASAEDASALIDALSALGEININGVT